MRHSQAACARPVLSRLTSAATTRTETLRPRALDPAGHPVEAVRPEQGQATLLRLHEVLDIVDPAQHGGGYHRQPTEVMDPGLRLRRGVVVQPLVRVNGGVRDLALDRHRPPVPQTRDQIGLVAAQHRLAAELTGLRRVSERPHGLREDLLEVAADQRLAPLPLLLRLPYIAPLRANPLSRQHRGRRRNGRLALRLGWVTALPHPRETAAIDYF